MEIAPSSFGQFAGDLLVGNFGDGMIHAYNATTGDFIGTLNGANGDPLVIDGLWALTIGNGGSGGSLNSRSISQPDPTEKPTACSEA